MSKSVTPHDRGLIGKRLLLNDTALYVRDAWFETLPGYDEE
jgi:hypothetical protein